MPKVNLKIDLLDKKQSHVFNAKYDTETRVAQVRTFRKTVASKYDIDPEHVHEEIAKGNRIKLKVYVDNATRKSIAMDGKVSNGDIDGKKKNTLDYLIEESFWKSLIAKHKLPLSTVILILFAGGGLFYLFKDIILPIFGVH